MSCEILTRCFVVLIFGFSVNGFRAFIVDNQEQVAGCHDGWTTFNGSCYLFGHLQPMTFVEAEHYCRQHGSHLIHVDSAQEDAFLKDFMARLVDTVFWTGLTDEMIEGVFRWYDTDTVATYTDWAPGHPNIHTGPTRDCVIYHQSYAFKWIETQCQSTLIQPACERKESEGPNLIG